MHIYILIALVSMLAGMVIARRNDVFSMFKGSEGRIKDKKVAMMFALIVVYLTFAYSYVSTATLVGGKFPDIPWGWVATLFLTAFGFLAPDAFIKVGNTIGKAVAGRIAAKGVAPPSV